MEDFQHVGYSKEVIEFVAVAKEFCDFVETIPSMERQDVFCRLQKFVPLIYLKGSLMPACDCDEEGLAEDSVTEEQYNYTVYSVSMMNIWKYSMIICSIVKLR